VKFNPKQPSYKIVCTPQIHGEKRCEITGGSQEMAVKKVNDKNFITTIQVKVVLYPRREQHKFTQIVVVNIFH